MRFVRLLVVFVVVAFLGIALLIGSIKDKAELAKPRGDLETMTEDDFYQGRFVEGTIYELWDNYAEMEEYDTTFGIKHNSRITAQYYAMPVISSYEGNGTAKFVALAISDSGEQKIADKMSQETDNYYEYDIEPDEWTTLEIKGKVTRLSGEGLEIFRQYFEEVGGSAENALPYVINSGNDGSGSGGALIIAIVLTVIGAGGTVFMIVRRVIRGR